MASFVYPAREFTSGLFILGLEPFLVYADVSGFVHRTDSSKHAAEVQPANSYDSIDNPADPAHVSE